MNNFLNFFVIDIFSQNLHKLFLSKLGGMKAPFPRNYSAELSCIAKNVTDKSRNPKIIQPFSSKSTRSTAENLLEYSTLNACVLHLNENRREDSNLYFQNEFFRALIRL